MIYLDTHVVVWLYAGAVEQLSAKAKESIEAYDLRISPMVVLELDYLREIGRIQVTGQTILEDLSPRIGLALCARPFADVIKAACRQTWTRDPFDRIMLVTRQQARPCCSPAIRTSAITTRGLRGGSQKPAIPRQPALAGDDRKNRLAVIALASRRRTAR